MLALLGLLMSMGVKQRIETREREEAGNHRAGKRNPPKIRRERLSLRQEVRERGGDHHAGRERHERVQPVLITKGGEAAE